MKEPIKLTDQDGEILVKAARRIVTDYLKTKDVSIDGNIGDQYPFECGVFVTLNDPNGLRGCIGFPLPDKKLYQALGEASIAAATQDPRFSPVTSDELDQITFEVTVLTPPVEIKVRDPKEYTSEIKVGRDGLIIKHSFFSGLLLPQVPVEYGWSEKEFLEHTCEKAGLARDYWMKKDTRVLKFEGIVFKEEEPNGRVIREHLG